MKNLFIFLAFLISANLSAQTTTTITKDLDTLVISKQAKTKVVKVGFLAYKDSTFTYDTTITQLKKYVPPTQPTNVPPIARAGSDQTITLPNVNTVTLNGNGSADSDGTIVSYRWALGATVVSTSSTATIVYTNAGTFNYTLTVTDDKGATGTDNVTVVVNPAVTPPTGTTLNLSFTTLTTDYPRPGGGYEQWHNGSATVGGMLQPLDVYYRFSWNQVEGATQGSYNWSYLDGLIRTAINRGQKLSFGIMAHRGETDGDGRVSYGGGTAYYPLYLHNLMQGETANSRDFLNSSGLWVPNHNSPNYLARLRALNQAIRDHLISDTYTATSGPNQGKTVRLADAILFIDIRGFGTWGEWHTCCGMSDWNAFPTGRQPTAASLMAIIDAHTQTFDRWPLVIMIAAYNGSSSTALNLFHPYNQVAYYALTARNAWGAVGFRKDQWGARDAYLANLAENNNASYNGSTQFKNLILDKWKTAPVTGEPMPGTWSDMGDLMRQVTTYHATSFGDGNYGGTPSSTTVNQVKAAARAAGYRLELKGGKVVTGDNKIAITLNWQNVGNASIYEDWEVLYELVSSNGTVVTLGGSTFKPKLFLPQSTPTVITDTYNEGISGTYTLRLTVRDLTGYRQPMPLNITGRQSNGSYILGTIQL